MIIAKRKPDLRIYEPPPETLDNIYTGKIIEDSYGYFSIALRIDNFQVSIPVCFKDKKIANNTMLEMLKSLKDGVEHELQEAGDDNDIKTGR